MQSFAAELHRLTGITLAAGQIQAFEVYAVMLADWNRRMNLTAITDPSGIRIKHFLDSLSCLSVIRSAGSCRMVDVGTGAGFPGIPIKIAHPSIRLTLVESVGKKLEFCHHVVNRLGLKDVEIVNARAEDIGQQTKYRESFDWAVARAVAEMPILAEYLLPLLRIGGRAIAQKGENGPAEAHAVSGSLRLLGGALEKVVPVELPGVVETRYLVVLKKTACTPRQYPRKAGVPKKKPIGLHRPTDALSKDLKNTN